MKKFSDLGIQAQSQGFIGDKIKTERLLGKLIVVLDYRIEPSNFEGERLHMQIQVREEKRIVFTSSKALLKAMKEHNRDDLPFETTIVKLENGQFNFT